MITISLCMIVKNEEDVLARCLGSVADLVEEIIVVDTGSTDKTKEVASHYTDKIYDFPWIDDFSAARNFAFSKATQEYIYTADADEVISPENREQFRRLKEVLLPEVEIVQMKYGNQLEFGTVYNYDEEYRPKLFKRLREFVWQEPIHEMVRLEPIVFDSEIVITHLPKSNHASRDLKNFRKQTGAGEVLSKRLQNMYAKELFLAGEEEDFLQAADYFAGQTRNTARSTEEILEACCVVARAARLSGDDYNFFKYATKVLAEEACSEICLEMGLYYEGHEDIEEAIIWFYNAAYEVQPQLALPTGKKLPLEGLVRCYEHLGMPEQAAEYAAELEKMQA